MTNSQVLKKADIDVSSAPLLKCRSCTQQLSIRADSCSHCGDKDPFGFVEIAHLGKQAYPPFLQLVIGIVGLIVMILLFTKLGSWGRDIYQSVYDFFKDDWLSWKIILLIPLYLLVITVAGMLNSLIKECFTGCIDLYANFIEPQSEAKRDAIVSRARVIYPDQSHELEQWEMYARRVYHLTYPKS